MKNLSGKKKEKKKIQKKNSRGTKKAVRRNEKIPEVRFFAVFFNQSHVLQEKFRRRWYFFSLNGADVWSTSFRPYVVWKGSKENGCIESGNCAD